MVSLLFVGDFFFTFACLTNLSFVLLLAFVGWYCWHTWWRWSILSMPTTIGNDSSGERSSARLPRWWSRIWKEEEEAQVQKIQPKDTVIFGQLTTTKSCQHLLITKFIILKSNFKSEFSCKERALRLLLLSVMVPTVKLNYQQL